MPIISELFTYPIKSCAGIELVRTRLVETGLEHDRNWMVTDAAGSMLTQRTYPRLALVRTALDGNDLVVDAPGMPTLRTPLSATALEGAATIRATVWRHTVDALDSGCETSHWFSDYLHSSARLARFAPVVRREVSTKWTGGLKTHTRFADRYPLLVLGQASLDELNARLASKGAPPVSIDRFRPNIVVTGLDAHEEDYVEHVDIRATDGHFRLRLVKPCTRCSVPTIDQRTGTPNPAWPREPLETMCTYRANARFDGALTFGMNAVVVDGEGAALEVGQAIEMEIGFCV
ncbi:MOSC domain-containing protein [Paraburkholderia susongensis]|uniref:MOSC domain-containing protein n=1 Tax=Paraburkholderia susongensis TaxID=1515439 RepID=A0A1X7LL69_9BURK|nr:MOSC N-terminal beta barrel domain-containing protein [Paraburkholderia susongensis]SMG54400.1 hypothetical protein SAMN06265784_106380 [Paraburkholderia susongensis]